jgi:hypothetical protein
MEARVGFEPTNGGFADLSLGPLGYRAELFSIAKLRQRFMNANGWALRSRLRVAAESAQTEVCAT